LAHLPLSYTPLYLMFAFFFDDLTYAV